MTLEDIARKLRWWASSDEVDIDTPYLLRLAEAIEENIGFDEHSGLCFCSCCDHGI